MSDLLRILLQGSIEYREWGYNATTVGAIGIAFFTLVESWALWNQAKLIWRERSGEALSFRWFTYLAAFFAASIPYGWHIESLAMVFSTVITGLMHVPVIIGIRRFKRLTPSEVVQSWAFILMVPAMLFFPWKEEIYVLFSLGTLYALGTQPWELYRAKSPGVVDVRLIIVYLASTLFWIMYAFAVKALALIIVTSGALGLFIITLLLWTRYKLQRA